eukprot:14354789-Ditylum_brightwellii.AAC.1
MGSGPLPLSSLPLSPPLSAHPPLRRSCPLHPPPRSKRWHPDFDGELEEIASCYFIYSLLKLFAPTLELLPALDTREYNQAVIT